MGELDKKEINSIYLKTKFISNFPFLYPFENNPYLWKKESIVKRFIRWLWYRYMDELYIPFNSKATLTIKGQGKKGVRISVVGKTKTGGVQEQYLNVE